VNEKSCLAQEVIDAAKHEPKKNRIEILLFCLMEFAETRYKLRCNAQNMCVEQAAEAANDAFAACELLKAEIMAATVERTCKYNAFCEGDPHDDDHCSWYYSCNKCGKVEISEPNYCPGCGARVIGREDAAGG